MSQPAEKKSNYVNVNLRILNDIFASKQIPVKCPRKWAESIGVVTVGGEGNLVLLNIQILEGVFSNQEAPIQVSRRWLEDLNITIQKEAKPIVVREAEFSVRPVDDFVIPDLGEVNPVSAQPVREGSNEPSGAVVFGSTVEEDEE